MSHSPPRRRASRVPPIVSVVSAYLTLAALVGAGLLFAAAHADPAGEDPLLGPAPAVRGAHAGHAAHAGPAAHAADPSPLASPDGRDGRHATFRLVALDASTVGIGPVGNCVVLRSPGETTILGGVAEARADQLATIERVELRLGAPDAQAVVDGMLPLSLPLPPFTLRADEAAHLVLQAPEGALAGVAEVTLQLDVEGDAPRFSIGSCKAAT